MNLFRKSFEFVAALIFVRWASRFRANMSLPVLLLWALLFLVGLVIFRAGQMSAKVFPSNAVRIGMTEKPLMEDNVVSCCGWCYPGAQIIAAFPELSGRKISHGICAVHKAAFQKELDAMQFLHRPMGK
jgi:hypothetical protein